MALYRGLGTTDVLTNYTNVFAVDTVTDLKAATLRPADIIVAVAGYHAADDGGGGIFRWDDTSTTTADDGIVFASDHTATGRWIRQHSGAIDVKWFGAKDDNSYNSTTAIQAAADYCFTNDKELDFGAGVYMISSTITLKCSCRFDKAQEQNNTDSIGIYVSPIGTYSYTGGAYTGLVVAVVFTAPKLCTIRDFSVIGNYTTPLPSTNGLLFDNAQRCQIEGITAFGFDGFGVDFSWCWDNVISSVSVVKCGNATYAGIQVTDGAGADNTNECVFNHLQAEICATKAIYVSPNTYNCTFNVIHAEQASSDGSNYTHSLRGGRGMVYNSVRCTGGDDTNGIKVLFGVAGGTYNGVSIEKEGNATAKVDFNYGADGVCTVENMYVEGDVEVMSTHLPATTITNMGITGNCIVDQPSQYVGGAPNVQPNLTLNNPTIEVLGSKLQLKSRWSAVNINGGIIDGIATTVTYDYGGRIIANGTFIQSVITLFNCLFQFDTCVFANTVTGAESSQVDIKNSRLDGALSIEGNLSTWRSLNTYYVGNVTHGGGNPCAVFSASDRFAGTVASQFASAPAGSGTMYAGEVHHNPIATSYLPEAWKCVVGGASATWIPQGSTGYAITSQFTDKTSAINLYYKYAGKAVFNTSTGVILFADGGTDVSTWSDAGGTAIYTPA